jgi:indole-3-glycerol phosphate synthase
MSGGARAGMATPGRATVLERILAETRVELERRKRLVSQEELETLSEQARIRASAQATADGARHDDAGARARGVSARGRDPEPSISEGRFHRALARPGIGVIAEFKRRSPSAGRLRDGGEVADVGTIAAAYELGGASALSVLTEGPSFEGSLADVGDARAACALPILRKDFIVDVYQLHEALVAGADAVLLIVAALEQGELALLHDHARTLGLDVLVEVHDRDELVRAARIGARLIGVNNRDLRDFKVDLTRTERLLAEMPVGTMVVSESGISAPEQLEQLECEGVAAVLVGESLMRAPDPRQALVELLKGSSQSKIAVGIDDTTEIEEGAGS